MISPQDFFLAAGLLFGIALVILIPPLQAPDEWMHFRRACHISEGHMMPDRYVAESVPVGNIARENVGGPLSERCIVMSKFAFFAIPYDKSLEGQVLNVHGLTEDPFQAGRRFSKEAIVSLFGQTPSVGAKDLVFFPNTAMHSPHLYIPQAVGIILGRLLGYPPIAGLYMGRFFNLLAWLGLMYLAIRVAPAGKWVFLLLALTPTSLFQSSSLSADVMTNGLSFLLIALFLRYAYGGGGRKYILPGIFILSWLVAVSKLYFFLVFLFLLVPGERFRNRKTYWAVFSLLVATTALIVSGWGYLVRNLYVPFRAGISPKEQLAYVLQHPAGFLLSCGKTLLADGAYYVRSFAGRLGHFSLYLPSWVIGVHVAVLILVSWAGDDSGISVRLRGKAVMAGVFAVGALCILGGQYLTGSLVGAAMISGVQGRYFIPFAPLLLLLLVRDKRISENGLNLIHTAVACYVPLLLAATCYVVVRGYYY